MTLPVISELARSLGLDFAKTARSLRSNGAGIILCYHRIVDQLDPSLYNVERGILARTFTRQLEWMCRWARPVALTELLTPAPGSLRFAVTFDDATEDHLRVAAPILKQRSIPATFYAVSEFVGSSQLWWWDLAFWLLSSMRLLGPPS